MSPANEINQSINYIVVELARIVTKGSPANAHHQHFDISLLMTLCYKIKLLFELGRKIHMSMPYLAQVGNYYIFKMSHPSITRYFTFQPNELEIT